MPRWKSVSERFWGAIEKTDSCWLWEAGKGSDGYGQFEVNGKKVKVHRYSYEIHKGEIPEGIDVLHTCDVRPCVNPDHLWLGTDADNNRDMREKGRAVDNRGKVYKSRNSHCKNGHELIGDNLKTTGRRGCRICANEYYRNRRMLLRTL